MFGALTLRVGGNPTVRYVSRLPLGTDLAEKYCVPSLLHLNHPKLLGQ